MTTRFNLWMLAFLTIFGLTYYWMLVDDRPGEVEAHPISMLQLRALAASMPGALPTEIRYEEVGSRYEPRILRAAGQGLKFIQFSARTYRIAIPNSAPIMIDTGLSEAAARRNGLEDYDAQLQKRVNAELRKASIVVTLSENELHSGAIAQASRALPARKPETGSECPGLRTLAKGVVEIPVCGKLVASRMIFVRLADRREILFMGDIAPTPENIAYQAGPSRFINDFYQHQDRKALHRWLQTVAKLRKQAPDLILVSGHTQVSPKDLVQHFF